MNYSYIHTHTHQFKEEKRKDLEILKIKKDFVCKEAIEARMRECEVIQDDLMRLYRANKFKIEKEIGTLSSNSFLARLHTYLLVKRQAKEIREGTIFKSRQV